MNDQKSSIVQEKLDILNKVITDNQSLVVRLKEKLSFVSGQAETLLGSSLKNEKENPNSPLVGELLSHIQNVSDSNSQIESILSNLEL